jgi:hypothetical protein
MAKDNAKEALTMFPILWVLMGLFPSFPGWAEEDPSLLAWYNFEEGRGQDLPDRTGHGYDGKRMGGKWVRQGTVFALRFERPGDHGECAPDRSFGLTDQVSLEVWVYPEAVPTSGEPAIAGQSYASFVLTYYTDGQCWWYIGGGGNNCRAPLGVGAWHHVVGTFDGKRLKLYVDGLLAASNPSRVATVPDGKGLFIAKQSVESPYSQGRTFTGMIAEVRLYNRALSDEEVARRYRTSHLTRTVDLTVFPLYFERQIGVEMSLRGLGERPPDTCVQLELWPVGRGKPVRTLQTGPRGPGDRAEATLKVGNLPPGEYELRCLPLNRKGQPLGLPSAKGVTWPQRPSWPNRPKGARVLNNLVTELLNLSPPRATSAVYRFVNPRQGWVFVATPPGTEVGLDGQEVASPEAMRWLAAGEHQLRLKVPAGQAGPRAVVRAIPTLGYCAFPANPHVAPFGPYDWAFLQKYVLPHCNLIVGNAAPEFRPFMEEWKKRGGQWIAPASVPGLGGQPVTAEEAEKAWSENPGMTEPLADGIIVDEFGAGNSPHYAAWTEAVRRIAANPQLQGKWFIPYCYGAMYGASGSGDFIRAVLEQGSPFANERYLPEQPTESAARHYLDQALRADAEGWNQGTPEGVRRMLMNLGYLAAPNESLDINPAVDWRVYMDLQMQVLATDPAFFGLWGVQWYLSSYADEEQVRLAARLFRHYAIEGRTERFLKDPYLLRHLQNPDFAEGLQGWTVAAAEPGSVTTGSMAGFSWLQGRYPPTNQGDTFLILRRSAAKPNIVAQKVRALQPGRFYSLRLFAADWKDLGKKQEVALSVTLEGVKEVAEKSFVYVINSCYSHLLGEFNAEHPAWFTFLFRVFQAQGPEATLTISDWAPAGGPVGQEIAVNFVQIQPYLAEE